VKKEEKTYENGEENKGQKSLEGGENEGAESETNPAEPEANGAEIDPSKEKLLAEGQKGKSGKKTSIFFEFDIPYAMEIV